MTRTKALSTLLAGLLLAGASAALLAPATAAAPGLAETPVNDIAKSPALKAAAEAEGAKVFQSQCAACHDADGKGTPGLHAPDLTDAAWLYSGDDLESGGVEMFPSDVEKTVLYGIRSGHPKARSEAVMPAFGPKGLGLLSNQEVDDVIDHLFTLAGRESEANAEKAKRGEALYKDKGNCWDCHGDDGIGNGAIGATDLTANLWLYGSDRTALARTILEGAAGTMPAFEGQLQPAEIKAVSVYTFGLAKKPD